MLYSCRLLSISCVYKVQVILGSGAAARALDAKLTQREGGKERQREERERDGVREGERERERDEDGEEGFIDWQQGGRLYWYKCHNARS